MDIINVLNLILVALVFIIFVLGMVYFSIVYKNRNNDFTLELVETQFVQIEDKETSIMQLEAQIEELNELIRLAGLEVEEETTVTCSKCKQLYEEPKKFCEKCGHQMVVKI